MGDEMNIFLCDLVGTFDGSFNRSEQLKVFKRLLEEMENEYGLISFSFVTSDDYDFLIKYIEELKFLITSKNINISTHFCYDKIYSDGDIKETSDLSKASKIIKYISDKDFDRIFFADDSSFEHELFKAILYQCYPDCELIEFRPNCEEIDGLYTSSMSGISGLNDCLEKHLSYKKTLKRKF